MYRGSIHFLIQTSVNVFYPLQIMSCESVKKYDIHIILVDSHSISYSLAGLGEMLIGSCGGACDRCKETS